MNELKEILKRSKDDVNRRWDGGDRVLAKIDKPKEIRWRVLATAVVSFCLIVISYSIFDGSRQFPRESIYIGDLYGDESVESSDELDETFDFYDDMV